MACMILLEFHAISILLHFHKIAALVHFHSIYLVCKLIVFALSLPSSKRISRTMSSAIALWRKVAELSTKQAVYKDGCWDQDFMKFMAYHYEPLVNTSYDELSLKWSKDRYDSDPKDCGFNRGLYYRTFWVDMEKAGVFIAGGDKK